jgi:hypothetical protein
VVGFLVGFFFCVGVVGTDCAGVVGTAAVVCAGATGAGVVVLPPSVLRPPELPN